MQWMQWGDQEMHPKFATEHFAIIGASGAGKTTLVDILRKSILTSRRHFRMLDYDPKRENLPMLYFLLGVTEAEVRTGMARVKSLLPTDERCYAWRLAADIDGPLSARQLATILVPDDEHSSGADEFFLSAVRDLLAAVLLVFIECAPNPGVWTFRDVLLGILYEPYLHFLMQMDHTREGRPFPMVARLRSAYLDRETGDTRTVANIRASVNSKLAIFEPIAAMWALAEADGRTFSLSEWVKDSCSDCLVLGNDDSARAVIDRLNRAIFQRATELLLARREATPAERNTGENQTIVCLDEIREAGNLNIGSLLTKSRSKNCVVILGMQTTEGLEEIYGENIANDILGNCNNIAVLKCNSPKTAAWASELFGRRLAHSQGSGHSYDADGRVQRSRDIGQDERPYLYSADFLYMPPPGPENGLQGFFRSPHIDPEKYDLRVHIPWAQVTRLRPQVPALPSDSWLSAYRPLPVSTHYLLPWTDADWRRLGFDRISALINFDAPQHHQPTLNLQPKTLRSTRS